MNSPWRRPGAWGGYTETIDAQTRLELVPRMDEVKLRKIIAWPETQKTVRAAAERRLKQLTKS